VKLFNDIYVLRIVIVFNLVSLLAAFCMGCSASQVTPDERGVKPPVETVSIK